ncbi:phosphoribosyl 1,2-cyclic phosphodiesterase [Ruminiclostridium sufflavum DSM 19573]|uniref:Phosphoribosyl 1,2-cyclic phosphodiesterase n=1 Tax=Ruminiclostridium sufflavum DSM 19573 TaxID=1121337 RepID=A0A318XMN1_9FIRM|nr:MBL fold metallo-hydrolase [Ruminiclostridium sufflavum]PYG87182.1 phosphoribosyl 1,2-cyclic phosphodiesterase [Ruminiclostridium sufflavum DSM 19573]
MVKFCSLFSGSSGNALFIGTDKTKLLIDAGLSGKRILEALCSIGENPAELNAILISHEHIDHVRGAGILSRKQDIPIYANESTWCAMEKGLGPVRLENRVAFCTENEFEIGDICIKPFSIPHDAAEPVGYSFFAQGKRITTATDIGHMNDEILAHIEGNDLLLIESNHDVEMLKVGPYPWHLKKRIMGDNGHLSNESCAEVIARLAERGGRRFILGHLSNENNFPELAYQTTLNALNEKKIAVGSDVFVEVALRDRVGSINIL